MKEKKEEAGKNSRIALKCILISCVLLLFTMFIVCVLVDTTTIHIQTKFSGREINIPLVSIYFWNGHGYDTETALFRTNKSLEQIEERVLKWDSDAVVEIWGERGLYISSNNPDTAKKDYYYIYREWEDPYMKNYPLFLYRDQLLYRICDYTCRIKTDDLAYEVLMPLHLFKSEMHTSPHDLSFEPEEKYELYPEATIEDIYNFYRDAGYYDVEMQDNYVVIKQALMDNTEFEDNQHYIFHSPLVIEILTQGERGFFVYRLENV